MSRPPIINFSVRDRAGDTLIEADFPRLAAERVAPRGAGAVLQAGGGGPILCWCRFPQVQAGGFLRRQS